MLVCSVFSVLLARKWYFPVLPGVNSSPVCFAFGAIRWHSRFTLRFSLPLLLSPEGTAKEQKNWVLVLLHFGEEMPLEKSFYEKRDNRL